MELFSKERETPLFQAVWKIAERVRSCGGRALLVGGCIRDALSGVSPKDLDLEIHGMSPEAVEKCITADFEADSVGKSFGVFKIHHYDIDVALPRRENKIGAGHKGFMVTPDPDMSYADAAARRDFTLNAVMYDPLNGEIIDPWHGMEDLKKGILRHVSEHFSEDPLRVLRAMQFAGRFGFTVAPETVKLCSEMRQDELPAERIATEWEKLLLKSVKPSAGLNFLRACGWVKYYPEPAALSGCRQNPRWHAEGDVWNHTLIALDAVPALRYGEPEKDLILALAVLCHDFGKPSCTEIRENGDIISHGHDEAGEEPTRNFINRIWRRNGLAESVVPFVKAHMRIMNLVEKDSSDKAYRRLALAVGNTDLLCRVCECDVRGSTVDRPGALEDALNALEIFRKRTEELQLKHEPPKPLLLGRHLLERGFKPGPEMGAVLKRCFEAQLDGEFTDLEGAFRYLETISKGIQNLNFKEC